MDEFEDSPYLSSCGVEAKKGMRDHFARLLEGFCDRIDKNMRAVNDVVYSGPGNDMPSRLPEIVHTATAVYPVHAKLDTSCDPDVVEINCAEYLVVRARRPIKKGRAVTRASCTSYLYDGEDERDDICEETGVWCGECRPCAEDWVGEEELRTRAEKGNVLINCPKCGSSLGMQKKVLRGDLSPSAVCGRNGCDELMSNIREMFVKLRDAAQKPTTQLTLPKTVEEGEKDLAEALQLVTEARKLFPFPYFYVSQLEHLADVLFIRLGNARPQSSEDADEKASTYRAPCHLLVYRT
jgi:hypothetical protein